MNHTLSFTDKSSVSSVIKILAHDDGVSIISSITMLQRQTSLGRLCILARNIWNKGLESINVDLKRWNHSNV